MLVKVWMFTSYSFEWTSSCQVSIYTTTSGVYIGRNIKKCLQVMNSYSSLSLMMFSFIHCWKTTCDSHQFSQSSFEGACVLKTLVCNDELHCLRESRPRGHEAFLDLSPNFIKFRLKFVTINVT